MSHVGAEEAVEATNRAVSTFFEDNNFRLDCLSSWQTSLHFGKDSNYQPRNVAPQKAYNLNISIMVFKEDETIIIIVTQIKGNERSLVDSFQINKSRIAVDVRSQLAGVLTKIGLTSLPQLMQMRLIRNIIIKHLSPKDFLRMETSCKLMRDICRAKETDCNFWKRKLKKDYDMDKEDMHSSYREAYKHEAVKRKNRTNDRENPLWVASFNPLRDERSRFPHPSRPNPLYPDPSIPNPFAPGVNPNGPFFGGPGTTQETFPSRPLRFPTPRGPPNLGPGGWPQFDRNDYI